MKKYLIYLLLVGFLATVAASVALANGKNNLIFNSSFEVDANGDNIPDFWTGNKKDSEPYYCGDAFKGSCSYRVKDFLF